MQTILKNRLVIFTMLIIGMTFVCLAMSAAFGGQHMPVNGEPGVRIQTTATATAERAIMQQPPIRDITAQPPVTDVVIYPTFGTSIVQPTATPAPTQTQPPAPTRTPTPIVIVIYPTFGTFVPPTPTQP